LGFYCGGIEPVSTIDWRGRLSVVVFFSGCNLRCGFCHNPDLVYGRKREWMNPSDLEEKLHYYSNLADSVVFTGGEPTIQKKGLYEACEVARNVGLKIMVNTNATRNWVVNELCERGLVDQFAIDVKAPLLMGIYAEVAGVNDKLYQYLSVKQSMIDIVDEQHIPLEVRTVAIPHKVNADDILHIAEDIKDYADEYYIQQFRNGVTLDPEYGKIEPFSSDVLKKIGFLVKKVGVRKVFIRGIEEGLVEIK